MPAFFFKQPNGKFGRVSTVVDTFTHYNLNKAAFKELVAFHCGTGEYEMAHFDEWIAGKYKFEQDRLRDVSEYFNLLMPLNNTVDEIVDKVKAMGCSEEQIACVRERLEKIQKEIEEDK